MKRRPPYIASAAVELPGARVGERHVGAFIVALRRRAALYRFWARCWLRDETERQHARTAAAELTAYAAELERRAAGNLNRSIAEIVEMDCCTVAT